MFWKGRFGECVGVVGIEVLGRALAPEKVGADVLDENSGLQIGGFGLFVRVVLVLSPGFALSGRQGPLTDHCGVLAYQPKSLWEIR